MNGRCAAALCGLVLLIGCGGEESACKPRTLGAQNHARFPAGETFWLPATEGCGDWALARKPEGATAELIVGDDGHARLTPQAPGTWTLKLGSATETLTVVPASERPFHHLNYYPSRALARVGDELWATSALRSEIGRFDPVTLANQGTITVGPWPVALGVGKDSAGADVVLVAQRGGDTLGFVDAKAGRLVDAIWVGDEPSNLVVSPDGGTAYVALATEAAVAVVDVAQRKVTARWEGPADPLGLALTTDGKHLAVAAHRSGHTDRFPWGTDPKAEERDIVVLDTATGAPSQWLIDVGTTIRSLAFSADGKRLYAALTRNDIQANLANPEEKSFEHLVVAFDPASGAELAKVDPSRDGGGFAVALHGLSQGGGALWVAAEGSDAVLALDPSTLKELRRYPASGRPRATLVDGDRLYVHGGQDLAVHTWTTSADAGSAPSATGHVGVDPRPKEVAAGQRYFTGAGRDYAKNWACNTCHTDGLTDTLTWNAGPFASRLVTRPFFWLEGTWPLGWQGYLSSIRNYAFTVNTNVGIRPTTDEAEQLGAYLSSLMPPPAANGLTERDGSLSPQAERGRKLYEGKAACTGCHALPLTSNRARIDASITEGPADVPSLVASYRQGVWLKHGEARTLRDGVKAAADWSKVSLSEGELDDLTRYVAELTARDFFVLTSTPRKQAKATPHGADRPVLLTFSRPVWDDPSNLAEITLADAAGAAVAVKATAEGRHVTVTPDTPLTAGATYTLKVGKAFRSWDDTAMFAAHELPVTVAATPALKLGGDYRWTVAMPVPKPDFSGFNTEVTAPATVVFYTTARGSGADAVVGYGDGLVYSATLSVDGADLVVPPLPVPVGPSFADSFGSKGKLVDDDGDGVADRAEGTLTIAGPGFEVADVAWKLSRPPSVDGCKAGPVDGAKAELSIDDKGRPVMSWDGGETGALGFYVTEPGANLPFGPGQKVTGGKTFWAATALKFPAGFKGPVTYGVLPEGAADATVDQGGPAGGAELPKGKCVQFGVITTKFEVVLYQRSF